MIETTSLPLVVLILNITSNRHERVHMTDFRGLMESVVALVEIDEDFLPDETGCRIRTGDSRAMMKSIAMKDHDGSPEKICRWYQLGKCQSRSDQSQAWVCCLHWED